MALPKREKPCPVCGEKTLISGDALRRRREAAGLTQREVARRAGISPAFLCDVEYDKRYVSKARAQQIIDALSVA